jgi:hypothetical protein
MGGSQRSRSPSFEHLGDSTSNTGQTQSAGLWFAGAKRQLSVEGSLVGGPRFAAGAIRGKVWKFVQNARSSEPEQHRYHHQVASAERSIEPLSITQANGKLV